MKLLKKLSKLFGAEQNENTQQKKQKTECNDDYQTLIQAKRLSRKSTSSCPSPSVCMRKTPSIIRKQMSDSSNEEQTLPRASTISDFTPRIERRSIPTTPAGLRRNLTSGSFKNNHL